MKGNGTIAVPDYGALSDHCKLSVKYCLSLP